VLLAWGAQYIPSAVTSIFNATVPLFAIVIAALVLHDEPITMNRLGGLILGFLGAVLLASPNLEAGGGSEDALLALAGEVAVLAASASYAGGAVWARRAVTGRSLFRAPENARRPGTPLEIAFAQVLLALPFTAALAVLAERPDGGVLALPPTPTAWLSVLWLGMLGSGLAYLFFFRIVRAWGATRTTVVTYLMPVVGITLGVIVLGETLHAAEIAGAALILLGIILVNSQIGARRLYGRPAPP
jgi:drug/metabolite transporter (DMT)-like permease